MTLCCGRKLLDTDTLEVTILKVEYMVTRQPRHVCGLPVPERGYEPKESRIKIPPVRTLRVISRK